MEKKTETKVPYLPLGSIVVLEGGLQKYMIIARGLNVRVREESCFFDYGACRYPEGLVGDRVMYFQHDKIRKVLFEGYTDEANEEMVEMILEQYEKLGLSHADAKQLNGMMENQNG